MVQLKIDSRKVKILMAANSIDGVSQLAALAELNFRTVSNMLKGQSFKSSSLEKLAASLGVNPLDLVATVGEPAPHVGDPAISVMTTALGVLEQPTH